MDLAEIARRQLQDYDCHRPGRIFQDAPPRLTLSQAYEVQRQVAALRAARGEEVAGYKIGCVSEVVQRQLGIGRPVFGRLFRTELYPSGTALDPGLFDNLSIEGEFAVQVGRDVPDPDWLLEHVDESVAAVAAVIELHNNVFHGARPSVQELIANNALHAGVVLPSGSGSKELDDVIAVYRNGERIGTERSGAVPGGPAGSLISVARHLASSGSRLRRGEWVLTGSPLPLYSVEPGDSIAVRSARSGEARATVLPAPCC